MFWLEILTAASIAHVLLLWMYVAIMAFSRQKIPSRVSFFEMQARAVRMRDVALPALAAALLGFFVSLASSFVHSGFSAPIATMLNLAGSSYVYLVFVGVVVSFVGLLALMDMMRSDARSLARHPASINRAAVLLLRGRDVDGLEVDDLHRNLESWQARAGREALRTVFGRKDSPRVNSLLQEIRKGERRPNIPSQVGIRLLRAAFADLRLRGALVALGFAVPLAASFAALIMAFASENPMADEAWRLVLPLVCLALQILGGLLFLRLNARFVIRCWRINEIELRAAKRRIARLKANSSGVHGVRRVQDPSSAVVSGAHRR